MLSLGPAFKNVFPQVPLFCFSFFPLKASQNDLYMSGLNHVIYYACVNRLFSTLTPFTDSKVKDRYFRNHAKCYTIKYRQNISLLKEIVKRLYILVEPISTLRAESPSIFPDKPTYLGRSKKTLLAG